MPRSQAVLQPRSELPAVQKELRNDPRRFRRGVRGLRAAAIATGSDRRAVSLRHILPALYRLRRRDLLPRGRS